MNGVDRVNNKIGYRVDNCVPCCSVCNIMKNTLGVADFLAHVQRIHQHQDSL